MLDVMTGIDAITLISNIRHLFERGMINEVELEKGIRDIQADWVLENMWLTSVV